MKYVRAAVLAVAALCLTTAAAGQSGGPQTLKTPPGAVDHSATPKLSPVTPQFVVRAQSLYANDETGADIAGSDEILVTFYDPISQKVRAPPVFGDFDTGETRGFHRSHACITPVDGERSSATQWPCERAGGSAPLAFSVSLTEVDNWSLGSVCATEEVLRQISRGRTGTVGCASDHIGRVSITLTAAQLLRAIPRVGDSTTRQVRIGGYTLTYVVRRVS